MSKLRLGKLTPAEAEAIALRRNQRTPGTIEVSEADYRRLVDEHRTMLAALKGWINYCDRLEGKPATVTSGLHMEHLREEARAAIKLAEQD